MQHEQKKNDIDTSNAHSTNNNNIFYRAESRMTTEHSTQLLCSTDQCIWTDEKKVPRHDSNEQKSSKQQNATKRWCIKTVFLLLWVRLLLLCCWCFCVVAFVVFCAVQQMTADAMNEHHSQSELCSPRHTVKCVKLWDKREKKSRNVIV